VDQKPIGRTPRSNSLRIPGFSMRCASSWLRTKAARAARSMRPLFVQRREGPLARRAGRRFRDGRAAHFCPASTHMPDVSRRALIMPRRSRLLSRQGRRRRTRSHRSMRRGILRGRSSGTPLVDVLRQVARLFAPASPQRNFRGRGATHQAGDGVAATQRGIRSTYSTSRPPAYIRPMWRSGSWQLDGLWIRAIPSS